MLFKRRIRKTDEFLVRDFFIKMSITIFLFLMLVFNYKEILRIWNTRNILLENRSFGFKVDNNFIASLIVSLVVTAILIILYWFKRKIKITQLQHRQKIARMVLENGWYESKKTKQDFFIKGLPISEKEKITYFPKMYYHHRNGVIHIKVEITMGKYQEQFQRLEKKLETGIFCECVMKESKESFFEYTLLYNMLNNRIKIDEIESKTGKMKLMKNLWWNYDKQPHMLCVGGTGGGKTYFFLTVIEALLKATANLFILDPKNSDLADLATVMDNVYSKKESMLECIENFYCGMMERTENMKKMPNYKTGKNYAYVGLPANFLIFDEYVAFIEMLNRKEQEEVLGYMKKIVMLGRQVGYFIILGCQRPDAKYLGDGIRDQFNFRVALGRNSELGYNMMFGDSDKDFFLKDIKGRGYLDNGVGAITEFYTPEVPEDYDFLGRIGSLVKQKASLREIVAEKEFVEKPINVEYDEVKKDEKIVGNNIE